MIVWLLSCWLSLLQQSVWHEQTSCMQGMPSCASPAHLELQQIPLERQHEHKKLLKCCRGGRSRGLTREDRARAQLGATAQLGF